MPRSVLGLCLAMCVLCPTPALAEAGPEVELKNPNAASAEELAALPHLNAELATAIVAGRPFATMSAVNDILARTLGADAREELYRTMFLPLDLNAAAPEEILLIPGVGSKMAREFDEYRPYKNIEQWRREMGKYIDKKEVARLERYVRVVVADNAASPSPGTAPAESTGPLDPNLATPEQLAALPALTPERVHSILAARPILDMLALNGLVGSSLSETERGELYKTLFIKVNLNSASEEELRLVPGVGKKIAREFTEYRPYKNMVQFRRELGKYLDKKEIERLESYVFVPVNVNSATEAELMAIPGMDAHAAQALIKQRPFSNAEQFRKELLRNVNGKNVALIERHVTFN